MYWAYDDSITEETDPNCAKWFSINGTRHLVAGCKVEPNEQVDGLSVFQFNTNYGSTSVAAVDSEGVSSPAVASGQAVPPATYVIKYDGNGADGGTAPTSQSKTQYTDITLATNSGGLTRIGYRFTGWNTAPEGTGMTYLAGATYSADEGVTLYAQWEAVDAVTFSRDGAVNSRDTVQLTPPKAEVTIYYSTDGGQNWQQGQLNQSVTINLYNEKSMPQSQTGVDVGIPEGGSVTLTAYAKYADGTKSEVTTGTYSLNKYAVRYEGNGNTSGTVPAEQTFYSGGSVTVQEPDAGLIRLGYTRTNTWNGDDGETYVALDTYSDNANLTLRPQWTAIEYTITYDPNSGSHSGNPARYTVETSEITLSPATRTGYTFKGWYKDGGSRVDAIAQGTTGDISLTAKWEPNTYYVSFDSNGGSGSMDPQQFTYDQPKQLTAMQFTRTDYEFTGWNTQANGRGTSYTDGQSISKLTDIAGGTVTLYAQWKIAVITLDASTISSADALRTVLANYSNCKITVDLGGKQLEVTNSDLATNTEFFTVKDGNKVTITNGEVAVTGDFSSVTDDFLLFSVKTGSTLDLSGCTLTGKDFGNAGVTAVKVSDGGSLTLTNTTISGFVSNSSGAGVYVGGGGSAIMNSGAITNNNARYGAAVYLFGSFTMNGGEISGNTNVNGSSISGDGTFEWNGGTISNNQNGTAEGGFVFSSKINYGGTKNKSDAS